MKNCIANDHLQRQQVAKQLVSYSCKHVFTSLSQIQVHAEQIQVEQVADIRQSQTPSLLTCSFCFISNSNPMIEL